MKKQVRTEEQTNAGSRYSPPADQCRLPMTTAAAAAATGPATATHRHSMRRRIAERSEEPAAARTYFLNSSAPTAKNRIPEPLALDAEPCACARPPRSLLQLVSGSSCHGCTGHPLSAPRPPAARSIRVRAMEGGKEQGQAEQQGKARLGQGQAASDCSQRASRQEASSVVSPLT